jgi:predicted dehydrogenase
MTCSGRFPFSNNDLVLYGSKGRVVCTNTVNMPPVGNLEITTQYDTSGMTSRTIDFPPWNNFGNELEAFSQAVMGNGEFHATGEEAVHSVEVSDAILRSRREGKTVRIG